MADQTTAERQAAITHSIVEQLEAGTPPWVRPWSNRPSDIAINSATKRPYSGANVLNLWMAQVANGFATPEWMSFKQANEKTKNQKGLGVRKGEHGTQIFFVSAIKRDEPNKSGKLVSRTIPFLKSYTVFNVAQIDGLPESTIPFVPHDERFAAVEHFISLVNAGVMHAENQPRYDEGKDLIFLPRPETFKAPEFYYSWSLHEHIKWTGHHNRLGRDFDKKWEGQADAFEELVCELGAAFLLAEYGLPGQVNHAEYMSQWIDVLGRDVKAIWSAGAFATKAITYLKQQAGLVPLPGVLSLDPAEDALDAVGV